MIAGPSRSETLWSAALDNCHLLEDGDTVCVFDKRSGETHFLNFLSREILQILGAAEASVSRLCEDVPARLGLDKKDCPAEIIKRAVLELDYAGLVQPVDPA